MESILRPVISIMNRLKYSGKFIVVGILLVAILAILTYQLSTLALNNAEFSDKELYGNEYIHQLLPIYKQAIHFRNREMAYMSGQTAAKDEMTNLQNKIDAAINEMNPIDQKLNKELSSTEEWNLRKAKWDKIKEGKFQGTIQEQFDLQRDFINSIITLIVHVADTSNLTLDPDIDSYYLMDVTTTKLPAFIEQVSLLIDIAAYNLAQVSAANESLYIIARSAAMDVYLPTINADFKKVSQYNAEVGGRFTAPMAELNAQMSEFVKLANQAVQSKTFDPTLSSAIIKSGNQLLDQSFKLYKFALDNNDEIIQTRVDHHMSNLYFNLILAIVSTLILIYLFLGIYVSIKQSIKILSSATDELAQGNLDTKVSLQTRDEMTKIAVSFNAMQNTIFNFIQETQFVVSSAVKGDLSMRIKTEDKQGYSKQLAEILNQLMSVCQNLIKEVKSSINTVNVASKEIASGSADLASRTENQASSLQQTSASLEELTSTVKQNAESAKQAKQFSITATEIANQGGEAVKNVVDTMGAINASSRKIVDIISVIDGIAFQTNILALNAAVEAARAGEQGRGFAVVATEVRNLAQRSAAAAKEIKALIVDSVDKIENGSKQVDQAGVRMNDIVQSVQKVAGIMVEITSASMQQSSGIEQVNQAVAQMDVITQENASLVSKTASTAQILREQTQHMNDLVSHFVIDKREKNQETQNTPPESDEKNTDHLSLKELTPMYDVEEKEKKNRVNPDVHQSSSRDEWKEF